LEAQEIAEASMTQDLRETMVERVAQRLGDMFQAGKTVTGREMARVAIEAMRVPTKTMLDAGPGEPYLDGYVWGKIIDAALAEPSGKERGGV